MSRPLSSARLVVFLLLAGGVVAQDPVARAPAPLRVLVPGEPTSEAPLTPMIREALEKVGARAAAVRPSEWASVSPDDVDFVLLSQTAVPHLERAATEEIEALDRMITHGVDLVVVGAAAGALPDSGIYSRLIDRAAESPRSSRTAPPSEVAVLVTDQKHPITQCIPHLVFERATITAACGERFALASATKRVDAGGGAAGPPEATPVFSVRRRRLGQVAVLALEVEPAERLPQSEAAASTSIPERGIVATLIGRVLEWMGRGEVTLHLPAHLPLAASRLGPGDTGALPGLMPLPGFYRGRQVAQFMTFHGADWLVRPDRELTERPEAVLDSLELKAGSTVVDLGAGVGYFSERMARRVGPRGKVLAVDIQKEMLEMLARRMEAAGIENVVPVLATAEDPRLPAGGVDLVLMVDVYHELSDPAPVLARVREALREGGPEQGPGRLVLVEYRGEDPSIRIKPLHRMTVQQARAELEPVGFRWVETKSFLPHQHVIIFERGSLERR